MVDQNRDEDATSEAAACIETAVAADPKNVVARGWRDKIRARRDDG